MKSLKITFGLLTADAAVIAVVPAARIVPQRQRTGTTPPYITTRRLSSEGWHNDTETNAYMDTVEVNCYAKEQEEALDLAEKCITAVHRKTPGTYNGEELILSTHSDTQDLTDDGADTDGLFQVSLKFLINYGA